MASIGLNSFSDCISLTSVTILNPECSIDFNSPYNRDTLGFRGTTVIYGFPDSTAQSCAEQYGYIFIALQWSEPTYAWAEDDSAVTASRAVVGLESVGEVETVETVFEITTPPGCETAGEGTYTTSFANPAFAKQTKTVILPAVGHLPGTLTHENEKAPTCTGKGSYDEVVRCTVCQMELSREKKESAALGHDYAAVVTAPTCTEKGYTTYTCSRCGDSYTGGETAALGHDFGEWVRIVTPTCTASGWDFRQCNRCDAHESRDLSMTEHTYVNGICTVCGAKDPDYVPTVLFEDVGEGAFYYDAVMWAVAHEPQVTAGTDEGHFSPGNPCTRGQVVAFLWRASGCPEPKSTEHPFTDVKESAFYYKAMLWAVENGITTGASKTTFAPGKPCTRGQVVTFLWRAKGSPEPQNTAHPFTDVKESGYYYKAMLWAVENGVTTGASKTTFAPDKSCTRGQVVTFLYRAYK